MNIEAVIIEHLRGFGFDAYADVPKPRPERFVTVERTGGRSKYGIDYPTVAIQAWASTRYEASELIKEVDSVMPNLVAHPEVNRCQRGNMYNYPDEDQARYQAVYDLVTY